MRENGFTARGAVSYETSLLPQAAAAGLRESFVVHSKASPSPQMGGLGYDGLLSQASKPAAFKLGLHGLFWRVNCCCGARLR